MRVDRTPNINNYQNRQTYETKTKNEEKNINISKEIKDVLQGIEKFEASVLADELQSYDLIKLKNLESKSEDIYGKLEKMVEDMIRDQKSTIELLNRESRLGGNKDLLIQAKESLGQEGKLGSELMSQRVSDFIVTGSGGDKAKIDILVKAIDEVYKEAQVLLGDLPEVSDQTYQKIILKLDKYIYTELFNKDPESAKVQLKEIIKEILIDQYRNQDGSEEMEVTTAYRAGETRTNSQPIGYEGEELVLAEPPAKAQASLPRDLKLGDGVIPEEGEITKDINLNSNPIEKILREDMGLAKDISLLEKTLVGEKEAALKGFHLESRSVDIEGKSERIIGFVRMASDGDLGKLNLFRNEIIGVFKEAEDILGKLPSRSQKTYERIMAGLILVEKDLQMTRYPRPSIFMEAMNFFRAFRKDSKVRIRTYLFTLLVWLTIYYTFKYWW